MVVPALVAGAVVPAAAAGVVVVAAAQKCTSIFAHHQHRRQHPCRHQHAFSPRVQAILIYGFWYLKGPHSPITGSS